MERAVPKGASICDIGAAPYTATETLARLGYHVTAYDTALPAESLARWLSFEVIKGDTSTAHIQLPSGTFDAVVMSEVFEHLHVNPIITMREVQRILKPGGLLYLTTPNGLGLRKICKVVREGKFTDFYENWSRLEASGEMGHVTEYTPFEIRHFMEQCGFRSVNVRTENVYSKSNKFEHYFWKLVTTPFPLKRETIVCTASKP
ncbi:class I SAM-dependent methyltransferase [Hyphomicrobium sp. 802]|uniref:class I SAM-dependent methyltransferase n=1 Tax=Hyphomicrobium sp. 802 TaxID=1112272 RepID=UPI002477F641|nr:class I SAM-dependent methyltransferase [Hyphomicrobium sp. 802]